ncbi:Crp/Fnr family transcriptional regulator [Clostridium sediminicola]|uniref:Crp/Fnr family transcriptional regulator n=1 Tax=Clostridium sediminicola TaxID=3114879 RepID=UPI0031F25380
MKNFIEALTKCSLFEEFQNEELEGIISGLNYKIEQYNKNQYIAMEGDPIGGIGIVINGSVEVQKCFPSGKTVAINRLHEGGVFGEVIIFSSKHVYPSAVVSTTDSKVLFISKTDIIKLCKEHDEFLSEFMSTLSNKILILSNKLKNLSYETIRGKIVSFLLEEYEVHQNPVIELRISKKELAEHFGITRPSLSRELIKMREEGYIAFDKNTITINSIDDLEDLLIN